jgi:hypothetical protein
MKTIVILLVLGAVSLFGEVIKLVPYAGAVEYDSNENKSIKDESSLYGLYANIGTLNYLLELNYGYMETVYKDKNTENLLQHDATFVYSRYLTNVMFKAGLHYVDTNDIILGNGAVAIVGVSGYNYVGSDKYTHGLEGYYSYYQEGRDETTPVTAKPLEIGIFQVSTYINFFKYISPTMNNTLNLKLNYQVANDYVQKEYLSYEISDMFYYNSFFLELSYYGGEMRSGVKDGGMTVFNSLDLQKSGYSAKLGYYFTKDFVASLSLGSNSYVEYLLIEETTSTVGVATLSYRF